MFLSVFVLLLFLILIDRKPSEAQFVQPVPVGMMAIPAPDMMQYPFGMGMGMGNPFDQGFDMEYNPIVQLVSSVAHMMEMNQHQNQVMKSRETGGMQQMQEMQQIHSRNELEPILRKMGPKFNLIPFTKEGLMGQGQGGQGSMKTSRIVNSIPSENVPPVMYRIGDLLSNFDPKKSATENLYDTTKIKGFPILKSSDESEMLGKKMFDFGMKQGENKQWKLYDIARRFLGIDEIPTAQEGNAIAQLFEESKKEQKIEKYDSI